VNRSFIVVAGGSGTRMNASVPKQFLLLANKPVLMHTLQNLHVAAPDAPIILVLPADQREYWSALCSAHHFSILHQVVAGGETRFHSVKNGLALATGDYVAVHDGVRPLVSKETIDRVFEAAYQHGAAVPAISPNDSVRILNGKASVAVERANVALVQTPQCFRLALIKKAFEQGYRKEFTDCASVLEADGVAVSTVNGNEENIKITRPQDLILADWYIKNSMPSKTS
jgi:2-C-methyl-D-erythritol 4-phosphate cytidylyltransferase